MFTISFVYRDNARCLGGVESNEDVNEEVNHFLHMHSASMWTYVIVTNNNTGKVTKVWKGIDGTRKAQVLKEGN